MSKQKGATTKSQSTSTTKSGSTQTGSSSSDSSPSTGSPSTGSTSGSTTTGSGSTDMTDTSGSSPSAQPSTTPSTGTDTTTGTGTGSDSAYGTGYGSTYTTTPSSTDTQPYQYSQQQPTQTTTYSTTTTTAGAYDDSVAADRAGYEYRPNRPMLATGLGIFGATYAASAIVGAQSDRDEDKRLYIPVVGPWLDLGQRDCGAGGCDQTEDWNRALIIGSGVLQGVGAGLAIASLFVPEERDRPRSAAAEKAKSTAAAKPTVRVAPIGVRAGGGFGAIGTF